MELRHLAISKVKPFDRDIEIDFESIGPGTIAICGENGTGKTTLMESSCPGILYREFPSRADKSVAEQAFGRDAMIAEEFAHNGRIYRIVNTIDADKRTQSPELMVVDPDDGEETPLSDGKTKDFDRAIESIFGPRDTLYTSVFAMQGGDRRFGGLKKSERKKVFRYFLGLEHLQQVYEATNKRLREYDLERLDKLKEERRQWAETAEERQKEAQELEERQQQLEDRVAKLEGDYTEVQFIDQYDALESERHRLEQRKRKLDEEIDELKEEVADLDTRIERLGATADSSEVYKLEESYRAAYELVDKILKMDLEIERLETEYDKKESELGRAQEDSSIIDEVPCGGVGKYADCRFLQNARSARDKIEGLKQDLVEIEEAGSARVAERDELGDKLNEHLGEFEDASELRTHIDELRRKKDEYERAFNRRETYTQRLDDKQVERSEAEKRINEIEEQVPKELDELKDQKDETKRALGEAKWKLDQVRKDLATSQSKAEMAEKKCSELEADISESEEVQEQVDDLKLLRGTVGPDGVQALAIDAAGPRVSSLVNDLLSTCFGDIFRVSIATQKDKQDGGKKEAFDLEVEDMRDEESRSSGNMSKGEETIIDEAIRVALSLFRAERLSTRFETLWRDEVVGGLSEANQRRYVQMLIRARELGGFNQVLFVTHSEAAKKMADARIEFPERGKVQVVKGAEA